MALQLKATEAQLNVTSAELGACRASLEDITAGFNQLAAENADLKRALAAATGVSASLGAGAGAGAGAGVEDISRRKMIASDLDDWAKEQDLAEARRREFAAIVAAADKELADRDKK